MGLNSVDTANIVSMVNNLRVRSDNLEAQIQGAPISSLRIGTAIITTAKIADLAIATAKIDDGAITNAKIDSLSAAKVTAGTISADRIGAGTITATKLNVSTLSAISANFGTLTAGSISGITITANQIRTSTGSNLVILDSNNLFFYDSGNVILTLQPNAGGFVAGAGFGFFEFGSSSESGSFRGVAGMNSGLTDLIIGTANAPLLLIQALGSAGVNVETSGGDVHFNCNTFQINGSTKTAIVPTSKGYNALYCVESPDVWFFDIANSFEEIDPMFWEVTEGEYKTITNKKGQVILFRKRLGFATLRFTEKTKSQFLRNNRLWQH